MEKSMTLLRTNGPTSRVALLNLCLPKMRKGFIVQITMDGFLAGLTATSSSKSL
jgi:hypothetical protein